MSSEKDLEANANKIAKKHGFLSYKMRAVSQRGLPDRIFVGWGKTIFAEFKSEGEDLTPIQKHVISQIQDQGGTVYVVSTVKELDDVLKSECMAGMRGKTD